MVGGDFIVGHGGVLMCSGYMFSFGLNVIIVVITFCFVWERLVRFFIGRGYLQSYGYGIYVL